MSPYLVRLRPAGPSGPRGGASPVSPETVLQLDEKLREGGHMWTVSYKA